MVKPQLSWFWLLNRLFPTYVWLNPHPPPYCLCLFSALFLWTPVIHLLIIPVYLSLFPLTLCWFTCFPSSVPVPSPCVWLLVCPQFVFSFLFFFGLGRSFVSCFLLFFFFFYGLSLLVSAFGYLPLSQTSTITRFYTACGSSSLEIMATGILTKMYCLFFFIEFMTQQSRFQVSILSDLHPVGLGL